MAMAEGGFGTSQSQSDKFDKFLTQQEELLKYLKGDEYGGLGGGFNPAKYGVKAIKDTEKGTKEYKKKELPDLFERFQLDIAEGRLTPQQASTAYEAAARGAGQIEGTVKQSSKLARARAGVPSAKQYRRYTPFFQQTAQQMLGRTLSEPELQNYVSSFQGLGISNPNDVATTFGNFLTTGDEYRMRQYRFKPDMPTLNTGGAEAFAKMLNTSFG